MIVQFEYLNHKDEIRMRTVEVEALEFVRHPGYGYNSGWFLSGMCMDKMQRRSFSLNRILVPANQSVFSLTMGTRHEQN